MRFFFQVARERETSIGDLYCYLCKRDLSPPALCILKEVQFWRAHWSIKRSNVATDIPSLRFRASWSLASFPQVRQPVSLSFGSWSLPCSLAGVLSKVNFTAVVLIGWLLALTCWANLLKREGVSEVSLVARMRFVLKSVCLVQNLCHYSSIHLTRVHLVFHLSTCSFHHCCALSLFFSFNLFFCKGKRRQIQARGTPPTRQER